MMSFVVTPALVPSDDSVGAFEETGGSNSATWTNLGFAVSITSLTGVSTLLGLFSLAAAATGALATLTETASLAGGAVAAAATLTVEIVSSSSSSSCARSRSLANGLV